MKKSMILFSAMMVIMISCGPSRSKLNGEITALENKLYESSDTRFDKPKADSLYVLYKKYIEEFPADTINAKYIFNAASLAMNIDKPAEAVSLFDSFMEKYPSNPRAPVCMFFKGFIYENHMGDLDKAKELYLAFIEKYPENEFADDARNSLANLGKTPEEMIAEFEKMKADSVKNAAAKK